MSEHAKKSEFTWLDGVAVLGAILISIGAALAWLPAGFMVAGALLLGYVIIVAKNGGQ